MNILKVVKRLRMRVKKNNGGEDKERVDSAHPSLSFEERLEVLLWGDKKLGVVGIKGRMDKLDRMAKALLILSILTAVGLLDHLTNSGSNSSAGIVGRLLQGLLANLLGG